MNICILISKFSVGEGSEYIVMHSTDPNYRSDLLIAVQVCSERKLSTKRDLVIFGSWPDLRGQTTLEFGSFTCPQRPVSLPMRRSGKPRVGLQNLTSRWHSLPLRPRWQRLETLFARRKKDIYRKKTSLIFSYRFIMNQILFLRNKNEIKNGPKGYARPTKKGSRGEIRKKIDIWIFEITIWFLGSLRVEWCINFVIWIIRLRVRDSQT